MRREMLLLCGFLAACASAATGEGAELKSPAVETLEEDSTVQSLFTVLGEQHGCPLDLTLGALYRFPDGDVVLRQAVTCAEGRFSFVDMIFDLELQASRATAVVISGGHLERAYVATDGVVTQHTPEDFAALSEEWYAVKLGIGARALLRGPSAASEDSIGEVVPILAPTLTSTSGDAPPDPDSDDYVLLSAACQGCVAGLATGIQRASESAGCLQNQEWVASYDTLLENLNTESIPQASIDFGSIILTDYLETSGCSEASAGEFQYMVDNIVAVAGDPWVLVVACSPGPGSPGADDNLYVDGIFAEFYTQVSDSCPLICDPGDEEPCSEDGASLECRQMALDGPDGPGGDVFLIEDFGTCVDPTTL